MFKFSGIGLAHGRARENVTYKADGMRGELIISHSCESPVATSAAWPPHISHSSRGQGRCAACFLTWLCDSSSAQYFTQTHSPVMIYCLAAYGTTLRPDSCKCVTLGGSLWLRYTDPDSGWITCSFLWQDGDSFIVVDFIKPPESYHPVLSHIFIFQRRLNKQRAKRLYGSVFIPAHHFCISKGEKTLFYWLHVSDSIKDFRLRW